MAGRASFDLDRLVLEYERSLLVGVAGKTDRVLSCRRPNLLGTYCAMHVVALAALNQSFIDAMMKGHLELRLLLQMTGIAKLGLRLH